MKVDVAVLGVVRNGERAPADWRRRAVFLAQVTVFSAFTVEVAWVSAWWAMLVVIFGAAQIVGLQALFRWHKARQARARPVPPRGTGGFRFTGEAEFICGACAQGESHWLHDLQEVPRG